MFLLNRGFWEELKNYLTGFSNILINIITYPGRLRMTRNSYFYHSRNTSNHVLRELKINRSSIIQYNGYNTKHTIQSVLFYYSIKKFSYKNIQILSLRIIKFFLSLEQFVVQVPCKSARSPSQSRGSQWFRRVESCLWNDSFPDDYSRTIVAISA